jgi:hypothetical protein
MVDARYAVAAALAAVVVAAVGSRAVPLTRRTVLAAAPWSVAGGAVLVAGRAGAYDGVAIPAPLIAASLGGVALGSGILTSQLAALRGVTARDRYLAAGGLGAAAVVLATLVGYVEDPAWARVVWLAVAPVVAGVFAAGGYFVLGLLYTDAVVEFRLVGLYVVGAVVRARAPPAHGGEALGGGELGAVTALLVAVLDSVGVSASLWLLLPVHAALGAAYVGCCGWLARLYGPGGNGAALVAASAALGSSTVVLLSATLLG